ncbi:hypothetical protein SAMN05660199_00168 [Klenkia soli]|uniref:Uncharacterized protein n=1 Tax=Klenkia soli TaxID=1052260 RepID=A0A1H0C060_9ACTN|nr:hypothetical protein [Klenkia soli]SDN51283.1 hypothetical protein SAMN05660199_00168 [Klenkia soli]
MTAEGTWVPAFPGQRPPFEPGHTLSMQHGAWSPRRVEPLAAEMVAVVEDDPTVTWLRPVDRPALWAWARAEAQVQLLTEYLAKAAEETGDGVGDLDADRVQSAYLLLHRAEARATTGRTRLGLDALSRARLGRDTAATNVDMARLMAELERQAKDGAAPTRVPPATRGGEA